VSSEREWHAFFFLVIVAFFCKKANDCALFRQPLFSCSLSLTHARAHTRFCVLKRGTIEEGGGKSSSTTSFLCVRACSVSMCECACENVLARACVHVCVRARVRVRVCISMPVCLHVCLSHTHAHTHNLLQVAEPREIVGLQGGQPGEFQAECPARQGGGARQQGCCAPAGAAHGGEGAAGPPPPLFLPLPPRARVSRAAARQQGQRMAGRGRRVLLPPSSCLFLPTPFSRFGVSVHPSNVFVI